MRLVSRTLLIPTSKSSITRWLTDEYGNEWIYFEFFAENNNASTGSSFIIKNLDIMYNWTISLEIWKALTES